MSALITETITPWLLGTILLLALVMGGATIKSWRDMKRSPYFFMRRQAEKRLQSYAAVSLSLLLLFAATAVYAWRSPSDDTLRVAILPSFKPANPEVRAMLQANAIDRTETTLEVTTEADVETAIANNLAGQSIFEPVAAINPLELPTEYDIYEPEVAIQANTTLGAINFSTTIDDSYQAVNPRRLFPEGFYTLFATFDYDGMADGMVWSWLWRYNGKIVDGGNHVWQYGQDGPGYIYFGPEEGFANGEYSLEVWVNGELFTQNNVVMNTAALSAGN